MAALSYSMSYGGTDNDLAAGAQTVTVGSSAPGSGDIEVRLSSAALAAGMTMRSVKEALDIIWRQIYGSSVYTGTDFPNV
jgi:hypothetical protein